MPRITKISVLVENLREGPKTVEELSIASAMSHEQVRVAIVSLRSKGHNVVTRRGKSDGIIRKLNKYSIDADE